VELFEQIRREYDYGVGTIKGVARKLGIHRRMVREALGDAVPRERKINTRGKPRIEPFGESRLGEIQQCHIRLFLHSFEDDFAAVRGNIERANVEVRGQVCQLPLGAGL
jgi:hypothetical protein